MSFSGIIFDCDGVLVDSEKIAVELDRQLLAELGLIWTLEEIVGNFLGKSDQHFADVVESHLGIPLPSDWAANSQNRYREAFINQLEPVEGVLQAIREINLPRCVASSGSLEKIRFTLGLTGLLDQFEPHLFSSSQVARGKPHPDLFLLAADQMGWKPRECLVVEDSDAGIEAALAAGMRVVAYGGGLLSHQDKSHENVRVISAMSELPSAVISQWP